MNSCNEFMYSLDPHGVKKWGDMTHPAPMDAPPMQVDRLHCQYVSISVLAGASYVVVGETLGPSTPRSADDNM